MRRGVSTSLLSVALGAGCASTAPLDNPVLVRPSITSQLHEMENPALVSPGLPDASGYAETLETVLEVLNDYFEVKPTARYAGYIQTEPRIAPGYEQPWKHGSPNPRERLLATFQSIRHIAVARVTPGERGGYRVSIEVRKELEDLIRPIRSIYGSALFREQATLDRSPDIVTSTPIENVFWIPAGRDYAFEQHLLRQIQERAGRCQ